MTSVRPTNIVTSTDDLFFRKTMIAVDVEQKTDVDNVDIIKNVDDAEIPDESLIDSMSPLLNSMCVCGLYFRYRRIKSESKKSTNKVDPYDSDGGKVEKFDRRKLPMYYSIVVMVILWINAIRLFSMFSGDVSMGPLLLTKVMLLSWNCQCALQQTAFFIACYSGRLDRVLTDIRLKSPTCNAYVRRRAAQFAAATWVLIAANLAFLTYGMCFTGGMNDILLSPIGNQIQVSDIVPYRWLFIVIYIHLHPTWGFPIAMTFMLSTLFAHQFRELTTRLRHAIDSTDGISTSDVEEIRQQHQSLCRSVERADKFLMIYHVAAFCGPLVSTIILLYSIIFYSFISSNPIVLFIYLFWLSTGYFQLIMTSAGGIMVNHYAHKIRERIHNIKLSSLSSKTIGKVNVFLNRTSGDPIGFTVMGVMVIDRTAVISLLGLVITYFLLVVQLSNPSSGGSTSTSTLLNTTSIPTSNASWSSY